MLDDEPLTPRAYFHSGIAYFDRAPKTEVAKAYTQMGGCTYQGCDQPPSYWTTDYATLSSARKNVAVALMQAGVH
jgi:hypothetical protein